MKHPQFVFYERDSWFILDPVKGTPIHVEQLLLDASQITESGVRGEILQAHGVDLDQVSHLSPAQLRAIGIGAFKRFGPTSKGARRIRCQSGNPLPTRA